MTLRIGLAVSGSIAAYKAIHVARLLVGRGMTVQPLMTRSAERFVGAASLAGICGRPVLTDMFDPSYGGERHVDLARAIDLLLIAPATADLIARLATGRADDLVTALALSVDVPVVVAPAMHASMWANAATRRNVATLRADGRVILVGPVHGALASGEQGMGRLADPEDIVSAVITASRGGTSGTRRYADATQRDDAWPADRARATTDGARATADLAGLEVVVTAGPTVEDIDPVRFLSNRSSGRMGFAVAEQAALRGASVTLVSGPVELSTPHGVKRIDVRSAVEMQAALGRALVGADALVMAAAVSDFRPTEVSGHKVKKLAKAARGTLSLVENPDILAAIGGRRAGKKPVLVGFALETLAGAALVAEARRKLVAKKIDLVVANQAKDGFAGTTNRAVLVTASEAERLAEMPKQKLADRILDRVLTLARAPKTAPKGEAKGTKGAKRGAKGKRPGVRRKPKRRTPRKTRRTG